MTLSNQTNRNDYTGDGATLVFAYTWLAFAPADLQVYVNGVLKTLTTDYSVSNADGTFPSGGNVTFIVAPPSGQAVAIVRKVPYTQATSYPVAGAFPAASHEKALDKLTVLALQLLEATNRALTFAPASSKSGANIPDPVAGNFLRWNAAGTAFEWVSPSTLGLYVNPLTALGDLLYGGAAGVQSRLPISGNLEDVLGQAAGIPAWVKHFQKGANVASAAALTLGADGNFIHVTGTTTITSISAKVSGYLLVAAFDGVLTLTHNAASLILRDATDYKTAAGDVLIFVSEGAGNWRELARVQPVLRKGADIASAAALVLGADGQYFHVTGTTAITSLPIRPAGTSIFLEFDGTLILTHNAVSLILPNNGSNITTAAGDIAVFVSEGAGNWRGVAYQRASGAPLTSGILDRVTADTVVTNTAVETTIYTKSIPGGTLGASTQLRLKLRLKWGQAGATAAARTLTLRFKYGATTLVTAAPITTEDAAAVLLALNTPASIEYLLSGDGATNSQLAGVEIKGGSVISGVADNYEKVQGNNVQRGTSAIDSTVAQSLVVTAQWSAAFTNVSLTMEYAILEQL